MQINIEPEDLSRLETLIEKCRYSSHTNYCHKLSDEEDRLFKRIAKMFRRELKDYYTTNNKQFMEN